MTEWSDNGVEEDRHMPQQEVFFEQQLGDRRIEVLKVYDQQFAREAFNSMDEAALTTLWNSLEVEKTYDPVGLPTLNEPEDRAAFLWDELVEQAREDWRTFSFFVVTETTGTQADSLYISPDWPSAEAFAKTRLAA
jgi:hypothetical protein